MLIPITELVPHENWPAEYVPSDGTIDEALSKVYFKDYHTLLTDQGVGFEATIVLLEELSFRIPGFGETAVVLGSSTGPSVASFRLMMYAGDDGFVMRAGDLEFALRFPPEILRPVPPPDGASTQAYAQIALRGAVRLDRTLSIHHEGFDQISLTPMMIADSGITIAADNVRLDLSRITTLPEIIAAGFDESFVGVFIGEARIGLPETISVLMPESLVLRNAAIGSGGVSGTVDANFSPVYEETTRTYNGTGSGTLFGIPFGLRSVMLQLRENAFLASEIRGEMVLPFFDQPVAVDLGIGLDGSFSAALSAVQPTGVTRMDDGLIEFVRPGLLRASLDSIGFQKEGDNFLVKLSGRIQLLYGGFDWPEVEVRELSIDKEGHVRIEGGWLDLPDSKVLDNFNGFTLELTRIGFGNTSNRKWIGFSGGIRLVDEMAFGASVEGLKVLWDAAGHVDLQMSSISVELTVAEAFAFAGTVNYFQEGPTKGFRGDIALTLFPLETSFDASLMVGKNTQAPPYNFFYIFVDAELPAGIPLGQTNLAIYGFSALLGHNVEPSRAEEQEWFEWYLLPPVGTTATAKWVDRRGRQALGAGITLGTAADDGFSFAAKTLLVLTLPGPLLLIDGKANILKKRKELSGETQGDHRALAALDRRAETILINVQPRYKYDPMKARMLDIIGAAEGFFDFNRPDAWHLYLGQDEPHQKRIRAKILKGLFRADAYLMLDEEGARFGGSAGFDENYKYGPLSVSLKAQLDGRAEMGWSPPQADGTLRLEGRAGLRALGCKSSVSIDATLEVDTPQPYYVAGSFRVKLRTPWPLRDPSARVRLEWGNRDEEPIRDETLSAVAAEHLKVNEAWILRRYDHELTPPQSLSSDTPVIPIDSKLLLAFSRPVVDRALVGCNPPSPPHPERAGSWETLHELTAVHLSRAQGGQWVPVEGREDGAGDLFGMWLPLPAGEKAAGKLQLWSGSPFTYGRSSGRSYFDLFLDHNASYPCVRSDPAEEACFDFERTRQGSRPALFVEGDLIFERLFNNAATQGRIVSRPSVAVGTKQALLAPDPEGRAIHVRVTFPEPVSQARLFVSCDSAITARAFGAGQQLTSKSIAAGNDRELVLDARGIDAVEIAISTPGVAGSIWISRVCFTLQADRDRADEVDRVRSHLQKELMAATARWCGLGHLLQPDTLYQLKVSTLLRRWLDGQESVTDDRDDYVYFRTSSGPPGFFETKGLLRDLYPYVDSAASIPADGQQPVYRGYDVRIVFNENYVRSMYEGSLDLGVTLHDRNGVAAPDENGVPVTVTNEWATETGTEPRQADQLWLWSLHRPKPPDEGCVAGEDINHCVAPNSTLEARLLDRPLAALSLIEARLTAAPREEPLHRVSFNTSRFVTFLHHMQSLRNAVWDREAAPLSDEETEAIEEIAAARQSSGETFTAAAEGELFNRAWELFKLGYRPLQQRVELTLLRGASRRYAVLLESPEPLDWSRTTVALRQRSGAGGAFATPQGPLRIAFVSLPSHETSPTAYNAEWIDLLVERETDVNDFTIEYSGGVEDHTSFAQYFRFTNEARQPAGTAIRVHAGAAFADVAPSPEYLHRYGTAENETASWRLNPAGDTVRLLDARGSEQHRWRVFPAAEFEAIPFVLVRSADQTRVFLVFPDAPGGDVPLGRLRMEWRFRRDAGTAVPRLMRHGRANDEEAVIEFSIAELS